MKTWLPLRATWLLLLCLPLALAAQQNAALYDYDSTKYRVSNWPMNDMMHVLIEKYGAEFAKQQDAIDTLVARINDGRALADGNELKDHSAMPQARKVLGHYAGINADLYKALAKAAEEKKAEDADKAIKNLLEPAVKDTISITDTLKTLGAFNDLELTKLIAWLRLNEPERTTNAFTASVDALGRLTKAELLKACTAQTEAAACTAAVKKVLEGAEAKHEAAKKARKDAIAAWAKGGKAIVDGYAKAVDERVKEINEHYTILPEVPDSLGKYCADAKAKPCSDMKDALLGKLNKRKEAVSREFTCAMPLADYRPFFIDAFSDALIVLAETEKDGVNRTEAERLAEVNFYRILTQVLTSPTPDAGELCANHELKVFRRLTRAQVWAFRKGHLAGRKHPGVVIKGWGKRRLYKDKTVKTVLDAIHLKGSSDTTDWRKLRDHIKKTTLLSSRFRADPYLNPYQLTIVNRNRFSRRHTPRRLRHHVLRTRGMMALDDHDRFPFAVDHVTIKFEDGVIDAIVVDGEVTEDYRFLMERDGGHLDSVLLHHHYKARAGDTIQSTVRRSKVTFTNSNTPIPYGNVWNFYERFADRMPLYGYSQGSGVAYHGTSEPDYMLLLSDLLHFDPALQKATSNIAPGDTIITIDFRRETENGSSAGSGSTPSDVVTGPGNPGAAKGAAGNSSDPPTQLCAGLKKDDLRKMGEFRVFTDLVGLARNQPNGLLQSEYSWRLPVKPRRNQGVNFISFIEPQFTLVLHEQEEQRAFLGFDTSGTSTGKRYVDPLNLLANNLYRVGVKLTATQLSMRYLNSDFEFNPFCGYTRTMARDSVQGDFVQDTIPDGNGSTVVVKRRSYQHRDLDGIGQFTYGAELRWKMRPDGRFGFDLYGGVAWHTIQSTRFGFDETSWDMGGAFEPNMLFAGLDAHLFASPSQKFFFKFRWVADRHKVEDHFVQLMFGYNRNLRFNRSDDEKRKAADDKIKALLGRE